MNEFEELRKNWMDFHDFKKKYEKLPVEEYPNTVLESKPEPKVSVHIITYQHVKYIREAIESVLMQQTNFPFEVIIGDDESTDGTREICKEYAEKYSSKIRLFLHKRENNIAISGNPSHIFQYIYNTFQLRGKYISICSGDDFWTDPNKLQVQVDFLEGHHDYSICAHDSNIVNYKSEVVSYRMYKSEMLNKEYKDEYQLEEIFEGATFHTSSVLFRKNDLNIPAFAYIIQDITSEDYVLFLMLADKGPVKILSEVMSTYRKHKESITGSHNQFIDKGNKQLMNVNILLKLNSYFDFRYSEDINYQLNSSYKIIADEYKNKKESIRRLEKTIDDINYGRNSSLEHAKPFLKSVLRKISLYKK
jgi:glycosyltransferase involved in cell wall biosynthesis